MLDVTKIALNTCLVVINCGLTITIPSMARKFITQSYELCPSGVYECPKEKYYFTALYMVLYISAILGCFISLFFKSANRRHRLISIHYLYIVSGFLSMFAFHFVVLLLVQSIVGVALGLSIVTVSVYIFEYTPQKYHKFYGSFMQMFFAIGLLLSYIFGVCYENIDYSNYSTAVTVVKVLEKVHLALPILFSGIALILLYFVFKYDTPYNLYATKKFQKYDKLKQKMKSLQEIDERTEYEDATKKKTIVLVKRDLPLSEVWENTSHRKLVIIGSILCLFYALNGYFFLFSNSFLFYKVYESMLANNLFTLGFIFLYLSFSISTAALLLHFKKKVLLITGISVQILALIGIIILRFIKLSGLTNEIILTVCMSIIFIGLAIGYGSSVWIFVSNHFPNSVKGVGSCISYAVLFLAVLIIHILYELLRRKYHVYLYISFLVSACLSLVFVCYFYNDEKDKSLKELKSTRKSQQMDTYKTNNSGFQNLKSEASVAELQKQQTEQTEEKPQTLSQEQIQEQA